MKTKKCCPEKVQFLIENEATAFTEDDREWLESMTEEQIEKLTPKTEEPAPTQNAQQTPGKTASDDGTDDKGVPIKDILAQNKQTPAEPPQSPEEFITNSDAPSEIKDVLLGGLRMHRGKKNQLIASFLANTNCPYTKQDLEAMTLEDLEKMAKFANVVNDDNDYTANSVRRTPDTREKTVEPLELPSMEMAD